DHGHPGTYIRVLEQGNVKNGDVMELVEESTIPLTIQQYYRLLFSTTKDQDVLQRAIDNNALPLSKREKLKKWA
ncbi:MAG: MOSC domain-containing protein, partial [Bacteroidota bacterium]|nr:MOSC domain-containing protein [Bacteroidota bacterium]